MANSRSALKRVRQIQTRTTQNKAVKSRVKTYRKALEAAVAEGDAEKAQKALNTLSSAADKAAKTNVIHKNAASHIKAKGAARIKTLS